MFFCHKFVALIALIIILQLSGCVLFFVDCNFTLIKKRSRFGPLYPTYLDHYLNSYFLISFFCLNFIVMSFILTP